MQAELYFGTFADVLTTLFVRSTRTSISNNFVKVRKI